MSVWYQFSYSVQEGFHFLPRNLLLYRQSRFQSYSWVYRWKDWSKDWKNLNIMALQFLWLNAFTWSKLGSGELGLKPFLSKCFLRHYSKTVSMIQIDFHSSITLYQHRRPIVKLTKERKSSLIWTRLELHYGAFLVPTDLSWPHSRLNNRRFL